MPPSPDTLALWQRAIRRALEAEPFLAAALLRAFATLRTRLDAPDVQQAIQRHDVGALEQLALNQAYIEQLLLPVKEEARKAVLRSARFVPKDVPAAPPPPTPPGGIPPVVPARTLTVRMDLLNPRVIDAIRTMETRATETIGADVRGTVRQVMERGLLAGENPRVIARALRDVIGLAPNQEQEVDNFRTALVNRDLKALRYQLRDKRYDATLERVLGKDGPGLSESQIERMTAAYRRKKIAWNAETNARTLAMDAYKTGQRLAIQDAVDRGVYDGARLTRKWIGVGDDRERPEHLVMNNTVVPWDAPYPNGDTYAGEGSPWNCRCLDLFASR